MSRGPGVWQRRILAAVEAETWCWLASLAPDGKRSTMVSARRAARQLTESGKIFSCLGRYCDGCGKLWLRPCCGQTRTALIVARDFESIRGRVPFTIALNGARTPEHRATIARRNASK